MIIIPCLMHHVLCWAVLCLVAQLCPTLCDPMDCGPPGSSVHGIFQARVLERVAISFSRVTSQPGDQAHISCVATWIFSPWASPGKPLVFFSSNHLIFPLPDFCCNNSLHPGSPFQSSSSELSEKPHPGLKSSVLSTK